MSTEKIHFKITLSGTYWDKQPHYVILVDDQEYVNAYITKPSDETEYVEFDCEVEEEQEHVLRIRLDNKMIQDTVTDTTDPDNHVIVKDMLLNIIDIEVDDIELGTLVQMKSTFKYDYPQNSPAPGATEWANCVNLGFNGTYELGFSSPFYLWLLDNI
jgi:hypothetical protein